MKKTTNTRAMKRRCHRTRRRRNPQKTRTGTRVLRRRNAQKTRTGTRTRARTQCSKVMRLTCRANGMKRIGVMELAGHIKHNTTYTSMDISNNKIGLLTTADGWRSENGDDKAPWLNPYGQSQMERPEGLEQLGVLALADGILNNNTLVTVNIVGNKIGKALLSKLQDIMKTHPTLKSLCGIPDDATEANLSGLRMDSDDAVVMANELPAKRALTSLNISRNNIGEILLPAGWTEEEDDDFNITYRHVDGRSQSQHPGNTEGVIAICGAISTMQTLVKFDISENKLNTEGGKALAEAFKGNTTLKELNIAQNELGYTHADGNTDMSGIFAIIDAIGELTALTKLNISWNNLGQNNAGWTMTRNGKYNSPDGCTVQKEMPDGIEFKPEAVIALADAIQKSTTMTDLDVSNNNIPGNKIENITAICEVRNISLRA